MGEARGTVKFPVDRASLFDLAFSFLARGVGVPLAFVANLFVARLLGPEHYGVYVTLLSAALVAGGVAAWGMGPVLTRELSRVQDADWPKVLGHVGIWAAKRVGLLSIVAMGLLFVWLWTGLAVPASTLATRLWTLLIVPVSAFAILVAGMLSGMREVARGQAIGTIFRNGVLLAGILALYALHFAQVDFVLLVQVLSFMIATGIGWLWITQRIPANQRGLNKIAKIEYKSKQILWRSATQFFAVSIAWLLLGRMDVVIVNAISGTTEAGYFGAAARLGQFGALAGLVLVAWLQPRISMQLRDGARAHLRHVLSLGFSISVLTSVIIVLGGWLLAPLLMKLLGDGFQPSVWPFRWLLLGYLPWAASVPYYAYLAMAGREQFLSRVLWFQVVVTLAVSVPLTQWYGALGASWAWAGGLSISSFLMIHQGVTFLRRGNVE